MKLSEIMQKVEILGQSCDFNAEISDICYDSRRASDGCVFVAIKGLSLDGNAYIPEAMAKGAVAVVTEYQPQDGARVPYVLVPNARKALAQMSAALFGNPQNALKLVGVTGTNGKTTVASLVAAVLEKAGKTCGLIGTNGIALTGMKAPAIERSTPTTPESYDLFKILAYMRDKGCSHAVMEVSSHALSLWRVYGLDFEVAAFTNLSRDHLNFHGDFDHYLEAKGRLFDKCRTAVINFDDPAGQKLIEGKSCYKITYSTEDNAASLVAKNIRLKADRVELEAVTTGHISRISLGIPGMFSVYNALAAVGCGLALDIELGVIAQALQEVKGIKGRAETVPVPADYTVIIDYAHSPDSMENILRAVKGFATGRVIGLFGCGGNRDKTKRPIMGRVAAQNCDVCVITSDNPRNEKPREIIDEIIPGTFGFDVPTHIITDRKKAIGFALKIAEPGDVVVLMGKGHETYQEIEGKKVHLDEREVVAEYFAGKA